jgi:predicted AlkP superfamily pyrophosphatase or phosphodiesterase
LFKRVLAVGAAAALVAAAAAYVLRPERGLPEGAPTLDRMAHAIGAPVMTHLHLGHVPGRSGEVMLVPKPQNFFIGEWDLSALGTDRVTLASSHPNPWDYLTRVPIVFYGPGYVRKKRANYESVDITSIAPTFARLLGMDDFEADGAPFAEIVPDEPAKTRPERKPPKVIFTVVIDGGGWNVLEEHPTAWPTISSLIAGGTTYFNATIGSAPSVTGALHATFGTGDYPVQHGLPGNQMRSEDGEIVDAWLQDADPRFLRSPTVSELWDERNNNDPIVGTVSYEGWHLGMIGHGAQRSGGDRDIAALWETSENEWWINENYYRIPSYVEDLGVERLEAYEQRLDPRDGVADDRWFGHTLEELQDPRVRPGTPAFVTLTGDAVVEVIENEPLGRDDVTDVFWVEMKMPDFAGHQWTMNSSEEEDVVRETDRQIERFIKALDEEVGRGNYLFVVSADHGQQPQVELTGGWRINQDEVARDVRSRFGDVVEKVTPFDMYIDMTALAESDHSLEDIARYFGTYTLRENIPEGAPGADRVPEGRLDEHLFAGAFPTDYLASLTEAEISSFGAGQYPEGDFTVGRGDTEQP